MYLLFSLALVFQLMVGFPQPILANPAQKPQENPIVIEPQPTLPEEVEEVELVALEALQTRENIIIQTKKGYQYQFFTAPRTAEEGVHYEKLSAESKVLFQNKRLFFLTRAATLLDFTELTIGFGSYTKDKLKRLFRKNTPEINGVRARGHEIVGKVLTALDSALWAQAPIVARQNEFALSAGIGLIAEAGVGSKGAGGSVGLGLNIGYNTETQAMVFEIFVDADIFNKAITPTFLLGLSPKIGFIMKEQRYNEEIRIRTGYSIYPPGVPGFLSNSTDMIIMGVNSSLFSFPPLIGDTFSYVNKFYRRPILRIDVSLTKKPKFRIGMGLHFNKAIECAKLFLGRNKKQ